MPHTIRFALDGATARLTEKLQTDIAADIRCGNLSSSVFPGGMKSVERLREHLALTLENFAVFLLPLSAFSSEEEIERWLSGLRGLCATESTSAG